MHDSDESDDAQNKAPKNDESMEVGTGEDRDSPTKSAGNRGNRTSQKAAEPQAYFPIREDVECMRFLDNTDENLLLDKVIHREIY